MPLEGGWQRAELARSVTRPKRRWPNNRVQRTALRPPMEERGGADTLGLALERCAVGELRLFELLGAGEMAIDRGRIGEQPEVLSWLQFRRIGRQKEQMHMVWDT